MGIELIIGLIGAITITGIFVRRENNRRNKRGKILTKTILKESIIPLRYNVRNFIKLLENETKTGRPTKPENLADSWDSIQLWKNRISPLFAVSGDVIKTEQQVVLGKILEDLEMEYDFTYIETDQTQIHGLDFRLTEYLKMNKNLVIEANKEANSRIQQRIDKISDSAKMASGKGLKLHYQNIIKENEEIIKDILKD